MGDVSDKFKKFLDPFSSKVIDPILGGMGLPNASGRNAAREQAAEQAKRAEEQAKRAADQAAEQARGEALNLQTSQERDRLLAEAEEQKSKPAAAPEVAIGPQESATERRKKYSAQSVGGTGQSGPSVRI